MKNYFLMFAILIATTITTQNINAQISPFGGGLGTELFPYEIYTLAHLYELSDSIKNSPAYPADNWSKGKYFILMNDIADSLRDPMGRATDNVTYNHRPFQGFFDGNNYKITLAINNYVEIINGNVSSIYYGLFSMTSNAKISNLIVDGYIRYTRGLHSTTYSVGAGAIVGLAYDSNEVYNCISYVDITTERSSLGGIIGRTDYSPMIKIENCVNYGNIESTGGYLDHGTIGGIIGIITGTLLSEIINCYNFGEIKGHTGIGGIIGRSNSSQTTITGCINFGFINGTENNIFISNSVGGIVGKANGAISNCINLGKITGVNDIGGIAGMTNSNTTITHIINCLNIADIEGNDNVGGIVGYRYAIGMNSIIDCKNSGYIKGKNNIGGIIGYINGATITNSINTGVIEGEENVGGISGNE